MRDIHLATVAGRANPSLSDLLEALIVLCPFNPALIIGGEIIGQ